MTAKVYYSNSQKKDIQNKYIINRKSIQQIAEDYSVSVTPIKVVLKEMGVVSRKPTETSRKYSLDETYFDVIDTEDKAYFFGLLMADGYNFEIRGAVTLILKEVDGHILKEFSSYLKTQKPIANVKNKNASNTCRLEICSQNISKKLSLHGCPQAKTFKIRFPPIDKNLLRHFIRGYFDGDGCISYSFARRDNYFNNSFLSVATFTSTEDFCLSLREILREELQINTSLTCRFPERKNSIRTLRVSGNQQVIKLMKWLYKDSDLYLKRKYLKFKEVIAILKDRSATITKLRAKK